MSDNRRPIQDYLPIEDISAKAWREKIVRKRIVSTREAPRIALEVLWLAEKERLRFADHEGQRAIDWARH